MLYIEKIGKSLIDRIESASGKASMHRNALIKQSKLRHENENSQQNSELDDDRIEVSVAALYNFLNAMLYGVLNDDNFYSPHIKNPNNIAVKAYNCTARMVNDKNIHVFEEKFLSRKNSYIDTNLDSESDKNKRIKIERFIQDLKVLESRGRYVLILTKNQTFIDSIDVAITRAKQEICDL